MDKELENYYEDQFTLFMQPGWTDFMEDVLKVLEPLEDVASIPDAATLHKRQGQIDILKWLLRRKEAFREAYDQLKETQE